MTDERSRAQVLGLVSRPAVDLGKVGGSLRLVAGGHAPILQVALTELTVGEVVTLVVGKKCRHSRKVSTAYDTKPTPHLSNL